MGPKDPTHHFRGLQEVSIQLIAPASGAFIGTDEEDTQTVAVSIQLIAPASGASKAAIVKLLASLFQFPFN